MSKAIFILLLLLAGLVQAEEVAPGWRLFTSAQEQYEGGKSDVQARSGSYCGVLKSVNPKVSRKHHALLLQAISADDFRGRRVILRGYLETDAVKGWSGIWMRVDDVDGKVLQFENMMDRPVKGTTPWTTYELKVEVPVEAHEIHFGALLAGSGTVRVDDFELTAVGAVLPGTELKQRIRNLPKEAQNLDFEG